MFGFSTKRLIDANRGESRAILTQAFIDVFGGFKPCEVIGPAQDDDPIVRGFCSRRFGTLGFHSVEKHALVTRDLISRQARHIDNDILGWEPTCKKIPKESRVRVMRPSHLGISSCEGVAKT